MKTNLNISEVARQLSAESGKSPESITNAIDEAKKIIKERPTKEQVISWFETDLHAASYALTAICSMPSLMKQLAEKFYEETTRQMDEKETENQIKNASRF